jgi:DNA-binding transcriptional regulator YhcF (GntR family)
MFTLHPDSHTPLVTQIVDGFRRLIAEGALRPGAKLPSIRSFAASRGVSVFTVVEAYDRLVARGWLTSKAHAGFFVKRRSGEAAEAGAPSPDLRFDARWYLKQIFENSNLAL